MTRQEAFKSLEDLITLNKLQGEILQRWQRAYKEYDSVYVWWKEFRPLLPEKVEVMSVVQRELVVTMITLLQNMIKRFLKERDLYFATLGGVK